MWLGAPRAGRHVMDQQISFCTTSDDVSIAYATLGDGPPLVYATGWPGHLAVEWETPFSRQLLEALAGGFTLIRYDMRGSGLSDRKVGEITLDLMLKDLAAVVDDLKLEQFALLSLGFLAGPVALTFAAEHPSRVSALIMSNGYLRGSELTTPERAHALVDYIRNFGFPLAIDDDMRKEDFENLQEVRKIQTEAAPLKVQASVAKVMLSVDVSTSVDRLSMPVLVMHGRHDKVVPFSLGRDLAARIPHASFVPLEEPTSAPWQQRNVIAKEIHRFLGVEAPQERAEARPLPAGTPLTILFTDIESSTSLTQQLGDAQAQELLRSHNSIVRDALAASDGSEVKHTGDGIMASFPSATRALECAIAIQRAIAERAEQSPWPLRVRIGLNAGEPVAEDADLFGTAVQLASRICDAAEPGHILASNVVRELTAGKGFLFADRGTAALRGFEDPVRVFDVNWRQE